MSDSKRSGSSIGFGGLLTLLFIALKLTHVINWSWWWVISPFFLTLAIYLGTFLIIGVVTLAIIAIVGAWGFFFKK
jgi:hypothetical protein